MVTAVPTGPEVGDRLAIAGAGTVTVKLTPLLACPPTVTTTFPVVAPLGTGAAMLVALQLAGVAAVPLKVTVLVPWLAPKFEPAIVTEVPTGPEAGDKLLMTGAGVVVPLLLFWLLLPPQPTTAASEPTTTAATNGRYGRRGRNANWETKPIWAIGYLLSANVGKWGQTSAGRQQCVGTVRSLASSEFVPFCSHASDGQQRRKLGMISATPSGG
jgi:hypothetical protein